MEPKGSQKGANKSGRLQENRRRESVSKSSF